MRAPSAGCLWSFWWACEAVGKAENAAERRFFELLCVASKPRSWYRTLLVSDLPDAHELPVLDLRGVACPVTWARAKVALEALRPGTRVTVLTDDERSARDLPKAAESEGYAVLAVTRKGTTTAIRIER